MFSAVALGFAAVVAWAGGCRFWRALSGSRTDAPAGRRGVLPSLGLAVVDIFRHTYFSLCEQNRPRGRAHMGLFYGFLLLVVATTLAFIYTQFLDKELSMPLQDPVKIIGNAGGVALFLGLTWLSWRRLARRGEAGKSDYFDWYFVGILSVVTITGFVLERIRFANLAGVVYSLYMVHLVFYFMLFTYLPYTKFVHVIYRTLALTHARQTGRLPGTRQPVVELL